MTRSDLQMILYIIIIIFPSLHVFLLFCKGCGLNTVCLFLSKAFSHDVFGFWRALSIEEVAMFLLYPPQKVQYQISTHTYLHPEKLRNLKKNLVCFHQLLNMAFKNMVPFGNLRRFFAGDDIIPPGASDDGIPLKWACFMAAATLE